MRLYALHHLFATWNCYSVSGQEGELTWPSGEDLGMRCQFHPCQLSVVRSRPPHGDHDASDTLHLLNRHPLRNCILHPRQTHLVVWCTQIVSLSLEPSMQW